MNTKPLTESLPDEHILQVDPPPRPSVDAGWRSRPHLYTGRALSAEGLFAEQRQRSGRLALRGQMVAPGVVAGLEVRLESEFDAALKRQVHLFQVAPGLGLTARGEDVVLPRATRVRVDRLLAFWEKDPQNGPKDFDVSVLAAEKVEDFPKTHEGLLAAVLVLVPVVSKRDETPAPGADPCEETPDDDAFEDSHLVDGCALVLYAWPPSWTPMPMPMPMPAADDPWRNRLAWDLFERERKRPHGQPAPWEEVGVPLALVGFHPPATLGEAATPRFIDRAAVVRAGGAPRARTPLVPGLGSPLLWQARAQQLTEHLASFTPEQLQNGTALKALAYLPPVGTLPRNALELGAGAFDPRRRFFPSGFQLEYVPVPLEQLDAVALASASLAPLDTTKPESVRVLVPVPQAHFEPGLLLEEKVGTEFQDAIDGGLKRLGEWRRRRKDLRGKSSLLLNALDGRKPNRFPDPSSGAIQGEYEGSKPAEPNPYGPEEEAYGTEEATVKALEEVLPPQAANTTWSAAALGFNAEDVSIAAPQGSAEEGFALVARQGEASLARTSFLETWEAWEDIPDVLPRQRLSLEGYRAVWCNGALAVVALVKESPLPTEPAAPNTYSVRVYHRTPGMDWAWEETATAQATRALGFTAVSWGTGCIDVFVATETTTTATPPTTTRDILKFTWVDGSTTPPDVTPLPQASGLTVADLVALQRVEGDHTRIELLFLGRTASSTAQPWLHQLSGLHEQNAAELTQLTLTQVERAVGRHLSASMSGAGRLDVLVMGDNGILHGRYEAVWTINEALVSPMSGDFIRVISRADRQLHTFWKKAEATQSQQPNNLWYAWFDGTRWHPPRHLMTAGLHPDSRQPFGAAFSGSTPNVFLAAVQGLQQLRMMPDSLRALVEQQGLRGIANQTDDLLNRVDGFIQASSTQVQADTQNVRQLMISGDTEASRLVVSPVLGATMVRSPLAARADIEHYFTKFIRRRLPPPDVEDPVSREDARETLQQATATRGALTERLVELVTELGIDVTGMTVAGVVQLTSSSPPEAEREDDTKFVKRENIPLRDLVLHRATLDAVLSRIRTEPDAIERATTAERHRWLRSDYFSAAVQHLEDMLVLLRELERRIRPRAAAAERYRQAIARIEQDAARLGQRLKLVDNEVAEARQDVTIARALLEEEKVRVEGINTRRQQVLQRHVPFFVFQRPRHHDLTRESAHRLLETGIVRDILPEVLTSTAAAPPELLAYVELVRDSPLLWFSLAPKLLRGLDRVWLIHRVFEWAQVRALQRLPVRYPTVFGRAASPYAQGLSRLLSSREELIARQRGAFVHFQPSYLYSRSWLELQRAAHEQLSLGDLIDTSHGRPDISEAASTELKQLGRVATGLYQRFGKVPPLIRLEWADQLSQYDAPVNLRDLSRLPKWEQVEVMDRRELQLLVDWLFQRVVPTRPEAVSLINDLVRVCLLLASHAPVNELLSGHVAKATTARAGGSLELAVDPARVRIGMHVLIRSGLETVQAVVEDLSSGVVRARVLLTSKQVVSLQAKASAYFSEPARGTGSLLPYVGLQR
jgi:hypothetical protein